MYEEKKHTHNQTSQELKAEVEECKTVWLGTLKHWRPKIDSIGFNDDVDLLRAIQSYGVQRVKNALVGARLEPKADNFDPGEHLTLRRVFGPKMFDKLERLGQETAHKTEANSELAKEMEKLEAHMKREMGQYYAF